MMNCLNHYRLWVVAGAAVMAAGCAAPDRYYLLSPEGLPQEAAVSGGTLGLGPVTIPDYVDRPEVVFQRGANRFEVPANHLWMGSLKENVTGVLAANLSGRMPATAVRVYPWSGTRPAVTVAVDLQRFHSVSGGDALLEAIWHVSGDAAGTHRASFEEPLAGDGYDGIVAAESRLLARLAEAIAVSLEGE